MQATLEMPATGSKSSDSREHNSIIFLNLHGNTVKTAGKKNGEFAHFYFI
jgi:hypothetical protein